MAIILNLHSLVYLNLLKDQMEMNLLPEENTHVPKRTSYILETYGCGLQLYYFMLTWNEIIQILQHN